MIERNALIQALENHKRVFWPAAPGRTNHRVAGIMLPIVNDGEWFVVMTLRKKGLKDHGGEMCFPGGKKERVDETLLDTAIRETEEEIGWRDAEIIGHLSSVPLYTSDYRLEPFVGVYPPQKLILSTDEVECAVFLPFTKLIEFKAFDGVEINWPEYGQFVSPVFFPDKILENPPTATPIFGGTAHVLWELISIGAKASGRSLPALEATLDRIPKHF